MQLVSVIAFIQSGRFATEPCRVPPPSLSQLNTEKDLGADFLRFPKDNIEHSR